MNWGTKLIIGMVIFMTYILVLVTLMMTSDSDALVDNNYYEKGIAYDKDYDKKENVLKDKAQPEVVLTDNDLTITFITQAVGTAKLIRTADKKLDQTMILKTDDANEFKIATTGKSTGLWKLQLEWTSDGKVYLYEKEVILK
jgi:hypothetical protein